MALSLDSLERSDKVGQLYSSLPGKCGCGEIRSSFLGERKKRMEWVVKCCPSYIEKKDKMVCNQSDAVKNGER